MKPLLAALPALLLLAGPTTRAADHVIQISVDGLRGDLLQQYLAANPELYPNFIRLQSQGASTFNARCDFDYSETVPNHSTMITGRPVLQPADAPNTAHHGYNINFPAPTDTLHNAGNPSLDYVHSTFDVAHDRGKSTAFFAGKTRLGFLERSFNADNGAPDLIGEDNGTDKIDVQLIYDGLSDGLLDVLTDALTNAPIHYTFLHLVEPDIPYGHSFGWGSPDWQDSIGLIDDQLGRMFAAIDANPALAGNVVVLLTGDHGGGGGNLRNHLDATHPFNYTIPFFLWGTGVPAGIDAYGLLANRFDPGQDRPTHDSESQPIRNGDAANLAMNFLGLPTVPGSFFLPQLGSGAPRIAIARDGDRFLLSWPKVPAGFVLERSPFVLPGSWEAIRDGITDDGNQFQLLWDPSEHGDSPLASQGFFRLRSIPFSIVTQPQSLIAFATTDAEFSVVTDGDGPLSYQWQFNGQPLPGQTGPALSLPNIQPLNAGLYSVEITDGSDVLSSEPATLEVLTAPVITQHPQSIAVVAGNAAVFTVAAFGLGPLAYQWRFNGEEIPGADGSSYTIDPVDPSHLGDYDVVVTDDLDSVTSLPATLTVPVMPTFVEHPQSQTVNVGDTVTFSVRIEGNPPPFHYRWRRGSITVFNDFSEALTSTLTLTNVALGDAGNYTVVATNLVSVFPGTLSSTAALTVNAP